MKNSFSLHYFMLASCFVLGNGILALPCENADMYTFLGYIISSVLVVAVFCLCSFLWDKSVLFLVPVSIYSLFVGAESFRSIAEFSHKVILPNTAPIWIYLSLGITVLFFALKGQAGLLKFSLISAVLVGGVIIFFAIASADRFDFRNIYIFSLPTLKNITAQTAPYFKNTVASAILLPIYFGLLSAEKRKKYEILGVIWGLALLGLGILTSLLLFTPSFAGKLEFPFNSAVSTVTVGRLFTRLDGFAYFVYFVCGIIKITVCLYISIQALRVLKNRINSHAVFVYAIS